MDSFFDEIKVHYDRVNGRDNIKIYRGIEEIQDSDIEQTLSSFAVFLEFCIPKIKDRKFYIFDRSKELSDIVFNFAIVENDEILFSFTTFESSYVISTPYIENIQKILKIVEKIMFDIKKKLKI